MGCSQEGKTMATEWRSGDSNLRLSKRSIIQLLQNNANMMRYNRSLSLKCVLFQAYPSLPCSISHLSPNSKPWAKFRSSSILSKWCSFSRTLGATTSSSPRRLTRKCRNRWWHRLRILISRCKPLSIRELLSSTTTNMLSRPFPSNNYLSWLNTHSWLNQAFMGTQGLVKVSGLSRLYRRKAGRVDWRICLCSSRESTKDLRS